MQEAAYKACTKCGERKPPEAFNRSKRNGDGLTSHCKSCHREYTRSWKARNRAAYNAYRAEWARGRRAVDPEAAREPDRRFAEHKGPAYQSWKAMNVRCSNPNQDSWEHYGARGIKVCARWASFDAFLADMGERPEGMTLDRVDSDGDYEPGNCRWATPTEQSRNQRRHKGKTWPK